jgi:N-acetylglutamate synthase/N-acetylornithine aminotransferase
MDSNGNFAYDKHKIFLYKEDFEKFTEGLEEVLNYIKSNCLKDGEAASKFNDVNFEEL